jgi:hypothetical protein
MDLVSEVKLNDTPDRPLYFRATEEKVRCNGECGQLFAPFYLEGGICDECAGL